MMHHTSPPHSYDKDDDVPYTAAFMRTTTITYILQCFTTTIVPVIHYYAYATKERRRQRKRVKHEKRMNCKIMML